jgi:hypothetical protein
MTRCTLPPPYRGKIIVFGLWFWCPFAGLAYQFLHYLIGLRRLGYDAYYVEDSARWVFNPHVNGFTPDVTANLELIVPVLRAHGFGDRWAFRGNYPGGQCYGMTESQLLSLYDEADAFLNVTGSQEIREEHRRCQRRIYIESDPFRSQVKAVQGDPVMNAMLDAHDTLFTYGENIGAADCDAPAGRFRWQPTRQPVVLDLWEDASAPAGPAFNTITTWQNAGKEIEWRGETYYWTKDREFEKFIDLPRRSGAPLEIAASLQAPIRSRLASHGWRCVDALGISSDPECYRKYIQHARGEFTVSRDQYVRPRTGWFSDRSACYLAAGRPVITQETGFSKILPTGEGLFAFNTMDEVLGAIDAIARDYPRNCRAAREIAEEFFAAEKVIGSLMERAGL